MTFLILVNKSLNIKMMLNFNLHFFRVIIFNLSFKSMKTSIYIHLLIRRYIKKKIHQCGPICTYLLNENEE